MAIAALFLQRMVLDIPKSKITGAAAGHEIRWSGRVHA
jgi:hypothetical protein